MPITVVQCGCCGARRVRSTDIPSSRLCPECGEYAMNLINEQLRIPFNPPRHEEAKKSS